MTLQQLADECSKLAEECQSFNVEGYLKKKIKTMDMFQYYPPGDPCALGLYVKQGIPGGDEGRAIEMGMCWDA